MKIGVYYLQSTNAVGRNVEDYNSDVLSKLSELTKNEIEMCELDDLKNYDFGMVFVGGGGTEAKFLSAFDKLEKPVYLLTTGVNNSLAASMEILSYLRQNDIKGEIIHGSIEYMAERISSISKVVSARKRISNMRLARVGKPSDWLISSDVDADKAKEIYGATIIDVTMDEFFDEIKKEEYEDNEFTLAFKNLKFNDAEKEKALHIYGALKRICDKYKLDGLTVRCFDLLDTVHSTGCVALALLNAMNIYASCEGDVPALISMCILGELTHEPIFMANPSRIMTDTNEIIFAHCTLPFNMSKEMTLMTHFESGIGVAFRGKIPTGDVTIFKTSGLMDRHFVSSGVIEENLSEINLCRTQIKLKLDKSVRYFLTESIGNHHLIISGNYSGLIEEFFNN